MTKRIVLTVALVLCGLFAAGALSAGRACAHDPRFACSPRAQSDPIVVADPGKSWAFYGSLAAGEEDHYVLKAPVRLRVPIGLLVDARDAANPGRPAAVLVGADGRHIVRIDTSNTTDFYEPFSRVDYRAGPVRMVTLEPGTSTLVVSMENGRAPQRYVLAVGEEERFSPLEIPYVLGAVYRIHNRRF